MGYMDVTLESEDPEKAREALEDLLLEFQIPHSHRITIENYES